MDPALTPSARTRVNRLPELARTDRADLDAVLDAALLAHVGFLDPGGNQPCVIPLAFAREGDRVLVHGSTGSRAIRALAAGVPTCLTVTLLDGLVYARSVFESSMHYRAAMLFGQFVALTDTALRDGLEVLTEHLMPGRWAQARQPNRRELAATSVLAMPIGEWSVKISDRWPDDPEDDLALPVWAGVIPRQDRWGAPLDAPDLRAEATAPAVPRPVPPALAQPRRGDR